MIVLDTNVVSELMRPAPAPQVLRWLDREEAAASTMTAVTAAELRYGVERLDEGARKRVLGLEVRAMIEEDFARRVLPFDVDAAPFYAELVVARRRAGRPIAVPDAQIAAICRLHGATLATRNVRDFDETGVLVVDPWTAD